MSHTTSIDAVVITDIAALRSAITELKRNGISCDLLENAIPRAYYPNQEGLGEAPFVVKLSDSKYDVGLYRTDKGNYEARADLYNNQVANVLGVTPKEGETKQQAALGKLYQMYAIHATTRKATQQGYVVNRTAKNDGTVQLQIAVAA